MPTYTHELPVAAPPATAWRTLGDIDGYPDWVAHPTRMPASPGGSRRGATYDERSLLLGPLTWRTHGQVVEVEDGRRQVHVGTGLPTLHRMVATFVVAPDGDGCRVRFTLDAEPRGLIGRAVSAALSPILRARQVRSVERLAELIATPR